MVIKQDNTKVKKRAWKHTYLGIFIVTVLIIGGLQDEMWWSSVIQLIVYSLCVLFIHHRRIDLTVVPRVFIGPKVVIIEEQQIHITDIDLSKSTINSKIIELYSISPRWVTPIKIKSDLLTESEILIFKKKIENKIKNKS